MIEKNATPVSKWHIYIKSMFNCYNGASKYLCIKFDHFKSVIASNFVMKFSAVNQLVIVAIPMIGSVTPSSVSDTMHIAALIYVTLPVYY